MGIMDIVLETGIVEEVDEGSPTYEFGVPLRSIASPIFSPLFSFTSEMCVYKELEP